MKCASSRCCTALLVLISCNRILRLGVVRHRQQGDPCDGSYDVLSDSRLQRDDSNDAVLPRMSFQDSAKRPFRRRKCIVLDDDNSSRLDVDRLLAVLVGSRLKLLEVLRVPSSPDPLEVFLGLLPVVESAVRDIV